MAEPGARAAQAVKDRAAERYNPVPNNYALELDPRCLWGWGPPTCRCRGGHACFRALGHPGKCSDGPSYMTCSRRQRPADWDSKQRLECNS